MVETLDLKRILRALRPFCYGPFNQKNIYIVKDGRLFIASPSLHTAFGVFKSLSETLSQNEIHYTQVTKYLALGFQYTSADDVRHSQRTEEKRSALRSLKLANELCAIADQL